MAAHDPVRLLPVIDIHAHIFAPQVEPLVRNDPRRVEEIEATAILQGRESTDHNRAVMLPACMSKMLDVTTRLADMDVMGVDVQVLSPSPGQYYYWADHDLARTIVELQNEHVAATVAAHPDRFVGLGALALQHPELAVEQMERAVRHFGFKGVEISTSACGMELSDPRFEPVWAKAEELGTIIFIHPLGTSLGARLDRFYLANIIGQPIETTIALSHLIFGGVLDRRPGLRIVAAHGGGYLPTYPDRSDHAWQTRPDSHSMEHSLSHYLRRIWFDSLVYKPTALRRLIDQVGAGQVVVGTDYPFDMGHYDVAGLVHSIDGLNAQDAEAILGGNLVNLLNLDPACFHNSCKSFGHVDKAHGD